MKKHYLFTLIFLLSFFFSFSQITSFPHTTTFESASDLSTTPGDAMTQWATATSGTAGHSQTFDTCDIAFTRNSGGTPSNYTGPSAAANGTYYVYVESTGSSSDKAEMAAIYDFSGRTNAQIDFKYHNYSYHGSPYGPASAALWVYNTETYTWKQNWSSTNNSSDWQTVTVDLSEYDDMVVQLWFTATTGAGNDVSSGYQSDFALDNIVVSANAYSANSVTTYYVDDTGSDSNNGLTSGAPFATLAKAVSMSDDGAGVTINVGAGTYTEEDIKFTRANVTIAGAGSGSTIFDGDGNGRFGFILANNVTIQDLQIKEYGVTSSCTTNGACGGGAIVVGTSKTSFVVNNAIFDANITNGTSGDGGAIEFYTGSTSTLNSTIFRNNKAGSAASYEVGRNGGASKGNGSATITFNNCIFHDNYARGWGAAHTNWMDSGGSSTFENCTFEGNVYYGSGGSTYSRYGSLTIRNSIVWNTLYDGDQAGYDIYDYGSLITATNIIHGGSNHGVTFSGTNSTSNPSFTDASSNDYTLQSTSPAIGAGNTDATATDFNGITRPQGTNDDIGAYEYRNTWTGSTDTDWGTTGNWDQGYEPKANTESPIIADVTNQPIISSDDGLSNDGNVLLEDITINSGAELTINKDASLKLVGDFTNNSGTVTLNSDASNFSSIIVQGSSTGDIIYNRYVNSLSGGSGWDLVGSPVDGLSISSFANTNDSPLATGGGSGSNQYAIGYYDNSADDWTNYTTATIGGAGNFDIGKGYQMATDSGATLAFTGTIATSDQTQAVQDYSGASGRIWNLVANPYPSYINANANADGTNNIISVNGTSNLHDSYLAVYGYDADTSGDGSNFTIINNTSAATYIAPGQAFMLAADNASSGTSVSFTEAMQTTTGGNDFISDTMENTEVELKIRHGETEIGSTLLFFEDGLTLGLDPGWDAGHFDDNAPIMTRLIENDEGYGMAINAMGLDAMENAVIPLVINQPAGQEFRINLHTATIPDPNVYLEDVEEGTFTNLYEGDFVYTPTSDLSGVGRFFIHMTADTMSNGEVSTSMLNAYKEIDASYITIEGLATQSNETKVSLYNILGREVLSTTLNNNMGTQTI